MRKIRKDYRLSDAAVETIKSVMKERYLTSETAALEFILKDYSERKSVAEEVVEAFNEKNKAWVERVKWVAQTAEQNSQDLYVAMNTILEHNKYKYYLDPKLLTNDVLAGAAKIRKERVSHFKQAKDQRERKGK